MVEVGHRSAEESVDETRAVDLQRQTIAGTVVYSLMILMELSLSHPALWMVRMLVAVNLLFSLLALKRMEER